MVVGGSLLVAVLVAVGVVVLVTGGDSDDKPKADGDSIRGVAILAASGSIDGSWNDCEGTGGYSDFSAGMRLSVKGKNDEIVGTGKVVNVESENIKDVVQADFDGESPIGLDATELDAGAAELQDTLENAEGAVCMLYFTADIDQSEYYSVELGSRGDLSFSREELKKRGYVVAFSLGDL